MTFLREMKEVKNPVFILTFFDLLFLILPGISVMYLYYHDQFVQLDWIKLILVSAAFMAPFVFINMLLFMGITEMGGEKENMFGDFSISIILTGLTIYLLFLAAHIMHRAPAEAINVIIIGEAIFAFCIAVRAKFFYRKKLR